MKTLNWFYIFMLLVLFACAKSDSAVPTATGKGGSLAKFTIAGNYIYAISGKSLYAINISNPANPVKVSETPIDFDIETIYPFKNRLYIGSRNGIYAFSIDTASAPRLIGSVSHLRSCDPVVANDTASYSTLRNGTSCGAATSGLYVYDVRNTQPLLKKVIAINQPIGLGQADSALYVCNGIEGLKVYSVKDAYQPTELKTITGNNFIDVIPYDDLLICWTAKGVVLYDITNRFHPAWVTEIAN